MDQKIYRARKLGTRLAISGRSFRWNTVALFVGYEGRGRPGCGGILFPEERREDSWIPKKKENRKKEEMHRIQFFSSAPFFRKFRLWEKNRGELCVPPSAKSLTPHRGIGAAKFPGAGRGRARKVPYRRSKDGSSITTRDVPCNWAGVETNQNCVSLVLVHSRGTIETILPPRDFLGSVTAISLSIWFDAIISRQLTWWMKLIEILFSYSDSLLNLLFFLIFEYFGEI